MQSIREQLEAYGIDYEGTMNRFMGNESLYVRILKKLEADKNAERLQKSVAAQDWEEAFTAAHTLKGVAANMGLTPLLEAVNTIVEPLRRKEIRSDYPQLSAAVMAQHKRILELVKELD